MPTFSLRNFRQGDLELLLLYSLHRRYLKQQQQQLGKIDERKREKRDEKKAEAVAGAKLWV